MKYLVILAFGSLMSVRALACGIWPDGGCGIPPHATLADGEGDEPIWLPT